MAKDKSAQQLTITTLEQMVTRKGKFISQDENGNVTFKYKKPRSSKMVTRVFPVTRVIGFTTSGNAGDTIMYFDSNTIDIGEVDKVKVNKHGFLECSNASGKISVMAKYADIIAESDKEDGDAKPKKKKKKEK